VVQVCDKVDKMLHKGMNEKKEDEWEQEIEKYFDGKALRVGYDNDMGKTVLHIRESGTKPLCGSQGNYRVADPTNYPCVWARICNKCKHIWELHNQDEAQG